MYSLPKMPKIYAVEHSSNDSKVKCPHCGARFNWAEKFFEHCDIKSLIYPLMLMQKIPFDIYIKRYFFIQLFIIFFAADFTFRMVNQLFDVFSMCQNNY